MQDQTQNMPFGWPMGPFLPASFPLPYIDDCDLFINSVVTGGPPGPPGPAGPTGPTGPQGEPGTPGLVPTTIVTSTPYDALLTDYFIGVDVAGAVSIVLPVSPTGTVFVIKDIDGDASTNPITITASTTIDGSTSASIDTNYGSVTLLFNGTEWNVI